MRGVFCFSLHILGYCKMSDINTNLPGDLSNNKIGFSINLSDIFNC